MKIATNTFVKRQTPDSPFSHFDGSWELLERLVAQHFHRARPGYKDGVKLVLVPVAGFYTSIVQLGAETPLEATFAPRREGEAPFIQVTVPAAHKQLANAVEVVVYSHETLGNDASTDADWEIVSINARPTEEPEPMTPMAMARNFLELPGGTKAEYTAEEFAKAIVFWSQHAMAGGGK